MLKSGFVVAAALCAGLVVSQSPAEAAPATSAFEIGNPSLLLVATKPAPSDRLAVGYGVRASSACENAEERAKEATCYVYEERVNARIGGCACSSTGAGYKCEVTIQCFNPEDAEQ